MSKPLVYVAGPYSHPDPVANTHKAIAFADRLWAEGLVAPHVPHLTLLWHLQIPHPIEVWYELDLAVLIRCDAVYRMAGESTGADAEVAVAASRDIPVFTTLGRLYEWAEKFAEDTA